MHLFFPPLERGGIKNFYDTDTKEQVKKVYFFKTMLGFRIPTPFMGIAIASFFTDFREQGKTCYENLPSFGCIIP
jgi:hypothetical protein